MIMPTMPVMDFIEVLAISRRPRRDRENAKVGPRHATQGRPFLEVRAEKQKGCEARSQPDLFAEGEGPTALSFNPVVQPASESFDS